MIKRKPQYPVDPIFVNRWSPRAISPNLSNRKKIEEIVFQGKFKGQK